VTTLRAHPALTSAVAGIGFGLLIFAGGGSSLDPVNVVGAVALGAAFAFAMFRRFKRSVP
jgi:hypothetical protein